MSEHSTEVRVSGDESTRVLLDLAVALATTSSTREAVSLILDAAMEIDGVDCGGIYLLEGESGTLRLEHSVGLSPEFARQESRLAADTPENQLVRRGEPLFGTFEELGQRSDNIRCREGLTGIAVLPFLHAGKIIGSLTLASRRAGGIPRGSRRAMEDLAAQIGGPLARIRTQEDQVELHESYRRILEKSDEIIVVMQDAQVRFATPAAARFLGHADGESLSVPAAMFLHPEDRERVIRNSLALQSGRPAPDRETFRLLAKDGSIHHAETRRGEIEWEGRPAVLSFLVDITERAKAEKALREGGEIFRAVFDSAAQGIAIRNLRGRIVQANEKMRSMLGYTREEIGGVRVADYTAAEDWEREKELIRQLKEGGIESFRIEKCCIRRDGSEFWADVTVSGLRDARGRLRAFVSTLIDITALKRAQEDVRALNQEIMRVQEEERRSIARDLHDHVAQNLSSLGIACETLFDGEPSVPESVGRRLEEMKSVLQNSIRSVRNLAYGLRPPELDQWGLGRTVREYCRELGEKSGLVIDFVSVGFENLKLGSNAEINLFRIVQEALANARNHAKTKRVRVRLVASFPKIILRIEDDGQGFDVEQTRADSASGKHMGLLSMSERASLLGGSLRIRSVPGQGTRVRAEIPLVEKRE